MGVGTSDVGVGFYLEVKSGKSVGRYHHPRPLERFEQPFFFDVMMVDRASGKLSLIAKKTLFIEPLSRWHPLNILIIDIKDGAPIAVHKNIRSDRCTSRKVGQCFSRNTRSTRIGGIDLREPDSNTTHG